MPTNVLRVNTNNWIVTGAGDPEGRERAPVGSIYLREDGAAGTSLYVKESGGVGYIGWKAMAIPAGGQAPVAHAASHGSGGADPITGPLTLSTPYPQIRLNAAIPMVQWQEIAAPVDRKKWRLFVSGEYFRFDCLNDAENAVTVTILTVARDGAITVNGILTAPAGLGTTPLNASQLLGGTVPDARLPANLAKKDAFNTFTQTQEFLDQVTFRSAYPMFNFVETDAPADAKNWQFVVNGQWFQINALNDAWSPVATPVQFNRSGSLWVANEIHERGRGTAMGDWIDEAFNAGRYGFTCAAAETSYMQVGGTVYQNINITNATIPSAGVLGIYTSFTATRNTMASAFVAVAGGYQPSAIFAIAGTNVLHLKQTSGLNYPAGFMTCHFTIPISIN